MRRNRSEACPHTEHEITEHHGLQRAVCRSCGHVTIDVVRASAPGILFRDWEHVGGFVERQAHTSA